MAALKTGDLDKAKEYFEEGRSLVELAPNWWEPRCSLLEKLILINKVYLAPVALYQVLLGYLASRSPLAS